MSKIIKNGIVYGETLLPAASNIVYDNTASGLNATTMQNAITELKDMYDLPKGYAWAGTQAQWDALTPVQKAVYDGKLIAIIDDASPIDYSTTEQDTGRKWIDGKPIYQLSALVSGSDLFDVNTLSIDKLVKVEALGSDNSGYTGNKWTIEGVSSNQSRLIYWNTSTGKITYEGSFPLYAATIWYTKTTDTVE